MEHFDVAIIGAGQSGLATAYYLRRTPLSVVLLDAHDQGGGSWNNTWDSLRLFSPARISSLPGWRLPPTRDYYPAPDEIVDYFRAYEQRYDFDIRHHTVVNSVTGSGPFTIRCANGSVFHARALVNATGNASRPFVPHYPGTFGGRQLHSSDYHRASDFLDQSVVVVGGGNSGAQIAADLLGTSSVTWCTQRPPRFLPDSYDGDTLFSLARMRIDASSSSVNISDLGDIISVPSVARARESGQLQAREMFSSLQSDGVCFPSGDTQRADAIIWCTGFRPALRHLKNYEFSRDNHHQPVVESTQSVDVPGMFFVGYGDWVGPAADTIIGVIPFAKQAAQQLQRLLLAT